MRPRRPSLSSPAHRVAFLNRPARHSQQTTCHRSCLSPLFSCCCALFSATENSQPLCNHTIAHSLHRNGGGTNSRPWLLVLAAPPFLRIFFQVTYTLSSLLATLTKTTGVVSLSSHSGTAVSSPPLVLRISQRRVRRLSILSRVTRYKSPVTTALVRGSTEERSAIL